jgi:hypothetical protein
MPKAVHLLLCQNFTAQNIDMASGKAITVSQATHGTLPTTKEGKKYTDNAYRPQVQSANTRASKMPNAVPVILFPMFVTTGSSSYVELLSLVRRGGLDW